MTGRQTMTVLISVALLSVLGLVGMLLVDGIWDVACFALTVTPLLLGAAALLTRRRS